jgi:threonine dehydrogenase-like Zn-dependent dehydrogenase
MGIVNRDGALAEYVVLPVVNLHEVPQEISDEAAVFTEPLAAAAEILEQLESVPTRRAVVLGDGRLGLLVAQVLGTAGVRITVAGRHAEKLQLARSWGMEVADLLKEPLPAASFALVVEATGSPAGLADALRLAEPRGTVVMKSTFSEPARFDTGKLVVDEINLLGSRCGNFSTALDLLRNGRVKVQEMISKTFPLQAGLEAFEYLGQPSCLKVLLRPSGATPG